MRMVRLPRTLGPKSTTPSILEISAASLGRRASNNSATRGRPPVMSLVLEALRGVLAIRVPATILSPSPTTMWAPDGDGVVGERLALVARR